MRAHERPLHDAIDRSLGPLDLSDALNLSQVVLAQRPGFGALFASLLLITPSSLPVALHVLPELVNKPLGLGGDVGSGSVGA